jgi:molybdate transport system substrate-binding protein
MSGMLLAAGAVKTAVEHLLAARPIPGLEIRYGTAGALRDRALAGEDADMVVTSDEGLAALRDAGRLHGAVLPLGRAGTGLAVADGVARLPIDTEEGFRAALLAARSIAWADPAKGATGGRHFERVIAALGIAEAIRAKGVLVDFGVDAIAACGRGEVDLAVSQATEIIGRPGVALLGLFPPPHDLSTGYGAAMLRDTPEARALRDLLGSPEASAALAAIGFTPTTQA